MTNPHIFESCNPDHNTTLLLYPFGDDVSGSITASNKDLIIIRGKYYLNDTLIDIKIQSTLLKLAPELRDKIYVFSALFYTKLSESNDTITAHDLVCRYTKNVDIFGFDYVIIPIGFLFHWSLAVIVRAVFDI